MKAITAAVARSAGGNLTLEDCQLSAPQACEILVRVEACGICHTDLVAVNQHWPVPLPAVLGHEGVGVVEALGEDVSEFAPGDRVLMSFGACGSCSRCTQNEPGYCQFAPVFQVQGRRLDGSSPLSQSGESLTGHFFAQSSFATHAVASITNVVKVDAEMPSHLLAPLACGVLTGAGAVLRSLQVRPGSALAVLGCGAVGLSAIMAARIAGCREIVAVDLNDERLALAVELGATGSLNSGRDPIKKSLRKLGGMDYVIDTTAVPELMRQGFDGLSARGTLLCVGVGRPGAELSLDMSMLLTGGRSVRGCIEGDALPQEFVPELVRHWLAGRLPLEKLVTTFPFAEINTAISALAAGTVIKPVLVMD